MIKYVSCKNHIIVILVSLSTVAVVLNRQDWNLRFNQLQMVEAFAVKKGGGFGGGGGFGASSKTSNNKKTKKKIKKKRKSFGHDGNNDDQQ